MAFLVLVGGIQFVYCLLAGNYVSFSLFPENRKKKKYEASWIEIELGLDLMYMLLMMMNVMKNSRLMPS